MASSQIPGNAVYQLKDESGFCSPADSLPGHCSGLRPDDGAGRGVGIDRIDKPMNSLLSKMLLKADPSQVGRAAELFED